MSTCDSDIGLTAPAYIALVKRECRNLHKTQAVARRSFGVELEVPLILTAMAGKDYKAWLDTVFVLGGAEDDVAHWHCG